MDPQLVLIGSKPKLLFKKTLSRDDLQKLYIPRSDVSKICPEAFDSGNPIQLVFCDSDKTPWNMTLRKTAGERWHLIGGWSGYASRWNFGEGQEISFFEYTCSTGAKFFMITSQPQPFYFYLWVSNNSYTIGLTWSAHKSLNWLY